MLHQQQRLNRTFHALADAGRRAIVEQLARGDCPVSELARPLPMSMSAVLQHLAVLEASGLVRSNKVGRVRTCRLDVAGLTVLENWLAQRRARIERRLDRLVAYLENEQEVKSTRRKR